MPITASRRSGTSFKKINEGFRTGKGVKRDNLCGPEPGSAVGAFPPASYGGSPPSTGVAALARLLQFGWIKRALSCSAVASVACSATTRPLLRAKQGRFRLNRFVPSDRMLMKAIAAYPYNVDGLPLCPMEVFQSAPSFLTIKTASFAFPYPGQGQCCGIRRRIHMCS